MQFDNFLIFLNMNACSRTVFLKYQINLSYDQIFLSSFVKFIFSPFILIKLSYFLFRKLQPKFYFASILYGKASSVLEVAKIIFSI